MNGNGAKGIFCLEGDWWNNLKRPTSVEPVLSLLRQWEPYYVPYIHRDVVSSETLFCFLDKWTQKRYADYPILYLAFHGTPGMIYVGDRRRKNGSLTLDQLAEYLEGRCRKKIIFLAACGSLKMHGNMLNRFLERTGALTVCGYTEQVPWLKANAFELLVFGAMQEFALTVKGAHAMRRKILRDAGALVRSLKFRMVIRKPA